jgi:starch synthase
MTQFLADNGRLSGILNGIDTEVFNPATDPTITTHYSASELSGKTACRQALQVEVGLPTQNEFPVFGMVSRLSSQKGFDLVLEAAPKLFESGLQLVIQGLGESHIVRGYHQLERHFPENFRLLNVFDAALAQRVYAGSDAFLMPSAFEPCGLGQLIAMRYGTVPVVRATGGLKDTVHDGENGFTFESRSVSQLENTVLRAVQVFGEKVAWTKLQLAGMQAEWGWDASATLYKSLYEQALHSRAGHVMR